MLGASEEAGLTAAERLKRDPDLEPLRNHPRYKALVARAKPRFSAFLAEKGARAKRDLS
jgi:hypothetical protein